MRDFEAYYAAGMAARAERDAYGREIWDYERTIDGVNPARTEVLPFVGPPSSLFLWKWIASFPYSIAVHVWQAILALSVLLAAVLCARLAGIGFSAPAACAVAIVFLAFGPLTSDLALGQVALPAFALVLLSVALAQRHAVAASIAGAIGFIQPNIGILIAGLMRDKRGALIAILSVLLAIEALVLSGGIPQLFAYLTVLQQHGAAERFSAIQLTPAAIAYGFGASAAFSQAVGACVAVLATIAWFAGVRKIRSTTALFAFTCAIAPLSMPFFHEHDLVVVLFPALFLIVRARGSLAIASFFLCSIDWLGLAQRPDGTVQTVLLATSGILAILALRPLRPREFVWPLCIIALAALFGAIAFEHPLPVWPDNMRAIAPGTGATIAQIWEAEQRATGLLTPNAFAALLRVFPLLGCALFSAQLYRLKSTALEDSKRPYAVPAASL